MFKTLLCLTLLVGLVVAQGTKDTEELSNAIGKCAWIDNFT